MKIAPSTPTLSIAATISSPVTWGGQFGTLCQGRLGVFASYAWTCESMMGIGDNLPHSAGTSLESKDATLQECVHLDRLHGGDRRGAGAGLSRQADPAGGGLHRR